ncbi:MAG: stage II sporulation protein P [bacterium]|nr:stage II sporulation protein P [bacterium]
MCRIGVKIRYVPVWLFLLTAGIFCLRNAQSSLQYSSDLLGKTLSILYPLSSVKDEKQRAGQNTDEDVSTEESWIAGILPIIRYSWSGKAQKSERKMDPFDPSYAHYQEMIRLYEEISMKNGLGEETEETPATAAEEQEKEESSKENAADVISIKNMSANGKIALPYSMEQLADYDFLIQKIYNVHSSTTAQRDVMNTSTFLEKDFSIEKQEGEPQILIYHSHSQELYLEEGAGEDGASVVAVGKILTENLENRGYSVYHDTTVYDLRDGKLDRSKAYTYALEGVQAILTKHPSIQVVIDLHRDGVAENVHLVTEIDGKPTAQIMFFNGMSQTPTGPIAYLENPYREENLAFSFQMQMEAMAKYPGLTRKIYLKGLRYNLHVRPRALLIEAGAQTNTFEEAKNAMEPLADVLDAVLGGKT